MTTEQLVCGLRAHRDSLKEMPALVTLGVAEDQEPGMSLSRPWARGQLREQGWAPGRSAKKQWGSRSAESCSALGF